MPSLLPPPPEAAHYASDADLLRVLVGPGAVHVERYGHGGEAVVLLHGFGTSSFLWRDLGPRIARRGHTAFAVDLFGHGQSDRPFDAAYGIAEQSEYLDQALTALRVQRALFVGNDLGAAIALRLVVTRPERVSALALINPIAFDAIPGGDIRELRRNTARFAVRATRGVLGVASLLGPILEQSVGDPSRMPVRLVARYLAPYVGTEGVQHLLLLARAVEPDDIEDIDLRLVNVPTLIIRGAADRWVPARVADRLATAISGSRLLQLAGIARLVPEEAPVELATLVLPLIEGVLPQEPGTAATV